MSTHIRNLLFKTLFSFYKEVVELLGSNCKRHQIKFSNKLVYFITLLHKIYNC